MARPFTLAHLTDVHLAPLPPFGPRHWNLKRALGYANWQRKRRRIHLRSVVDQLAADLRKQEIDHILVSGDLINIGLPQEYEHALDWLQALGDPQNISVIPGNHDIYCRLWTDQGTERWRPYMTNIGTGANQQVPDSGFPFVRHFHNIAIIGLNSAVPTPPGVASGEVGVSQLGRLAKILEQLGHDNVCRIVMIHHPPLPGQARPRRDLRDAETLSEILAQHGAELVVHGHNHRNMLSFHPSQGTNIPVVGAPSFSAGRGYRDEPLGAYNLYHLQCDGQGDCKTSHTIELVQRGFKDRNGTIMEIKRFPLAPDAAAMVKQA